MVNRVGSNPLTSHPAGGNGSDDDAVPDVDPSDTAGLLLERLQAWKHACGYLESYVGATEKAHKSQQKEYEKVLKSISEPLREGHHFDQSLGGIAGLFENMRTNTQAIADSHLDASRALASQVMPILTRLHQEIKIRFKETSNSLVKGSKSVATARNNTQKYIELLGQHAATYSASGGKLEPQNDPYVLQREVQYRLQKQVSEENNNRNELIAAQENFQSFEAHVIQTMQQALGHFLVYLGGQSDRQKALYTDVVATSQRIPLEFEWMNFLHRNGSLMIDPSAPARSAAQLTYPNHDHPSTRPLMAGPLERKSRALAGLTGFHSAYYVLTPAHYLHQFERMPDDRSREPTPDLSLHLPDCTLGALVADRFHIRGRDARKGLVGTAFQMTHELAFRAPSPAEAEKWWALLAECAGTVPGAPAAASAGGAAAAAAASTESSAYASEDKVPPPPLNTQDLPAGTMQHSSAGAATPSSAIPQSAASQSAVSQSAIPQSAASQTAAAGLGHVETPSSAVERTAAAPTAAAAEEGKNTLP